jgi:hypothetical protein
MICSKNKSFNITKLHVFRWLLMVVLAASLPISAQAAGGRGMGGGPRFSGGRSFAFHEAASLTASSFVTVSSHAAVSSQDSGSLGLGSPFHFAILIPIIGPGHETWTVKLLKSPALKTHITALKTSRTTAMKAPTTTKTSVTNTDRRHRE